MVVPDMVGFAEHMSLQPRPMLSEVIRGFPGALLPHVTPAIHAGEPRS